jgi:putative DNA primase/helicase
MTDGLYENPQFDNSPPPPPDYDGFSAVAVDDEDTDAKVDPYVPTYACGGRPVTELGLAERFVDDHGIDLRYVAQQGSWLVWDGRRWKHDEHSYTTRLAIETVRNMGRKPGTVEYRKPAVRKFAHQAENAAKLSSMVRLAQSDPALVVDAGSLDTKEHLLGVANGVVDLRTGELRPGHQNDLITKQAGTHYDPKAECPKWLAFLEQVMLGDLEMVAYLQMLSGYAATGSTDEHMMVVLLGGGRNGKSLFLELLAAAIGDYAQTMPAASLMESRKGDANGSGPSSDLARMRGARYVQASETNAGCRLAESKVKSMTSSDTQIARFLNQEFFEFKPTHTMFLATNHRPTIKGADKGIWSRLRLINFDYQVTAATMNKNLDKELLEELPGVLAWLVEGARRWYAEGLNTPAKVQQAVSDYKVEMDILGQFLDQECDVDADLETPTLSVDATPLYQHYRTWALDQGEKVIWTQKTFGTALHDKGFSKTLHPKRRTSVWHGLELRNTFAGVSDGFGP